MVRNRNVPAFFYKMGNFISHLIKKDASLWMRTRAKGNYCLTASRSARVCAMAHTFLYMGKLSFISYKNRRSAVDAHTF